MNSEAEILEDIIDVPKGTEVFQTFLGKTSARITAREQEALVKNYSKLFQLVNDRVPSFNKTPDTILFWTNYSEA